MDPSSPSEGPVEPKERRKIHFAVPATEPTQLDPRQVEMIRRRRPTPATLFRVADQTSPEDDITSHQWVVGENGVLKPKRINPNIYQPPSLKAVQQMAEAQMQKLDSQEQRDVAEQQPAIRKAGATAPTDEEEEEEEDVEAADNMAVEESRNVD
ncbi:protein phosphatase 1 regulatory subunit 1B isoform X2 [Ctenopharyngodon idella]|uniref:protein phosphatase 1 regulatory subunit 1B isoform X2 n=1 Tax=Ctenopharyngodon idella TaxID=7959 RepID=UPI002230D172|nr:protein phosphatase 1 regulatory subunit 1B isoform X2 [Ctenopharyngodon idella]